MLAMIMRVPQLLQIVGVLRECERTITRRDRASGPLRPLSPVWGASSALSRRVRRAQSACLGLKAVFVYAKPPDLRVECRYGHAQLSGSASGARYSSTTFGECRFDLFFLMCQQ